jgi:hypothetical protein
VYNNLFGSQWDFEEITAEVLEKNPEVIRMHQMYGYQETPELDFFLDDGSRVITMNLSKQNWLANPKFKNFFAEFPTTKWKKS